MSYKRDMYICDCGVDGVVLEFDEEIPEIWMCFWTRGLNPGNRFTLREKLRWIWHILRKGCPWTDEVGLNKEHAKELGERFREEFKKDSVSVGLYYANPQILAMAIEKAGSYDSKKVRDAVFGGEFAGTVMGDVKFNDKGLAFKPLIALQ